MPSSAVKTWASGSYVQMLQNGVPVDVSVEVGLASDSYVEIVSGLSEGREIIVSTVTAGSTGNASDEDDQGGILNQGGMPGPMEFPGGGGFPSGGMAPPGQ